MDYTNNKYSYTRNTYFSESIMHFRLFISISGLVIPEIHITQLALHILEYKYQY